MTLAVLILRQSLNTSMYLCKGPVLKYRRRIRRVEGTVTVTYLRVECTPYLEVLYRLFNSARKDQWKVAILVMELLLCIPISNAVVERLFSLMSRIKTKSRCSLSNKRMSKLIRLCLDGPPFNEFDATPFVEDWFTHSERRISQNRRKTYAQRKSDEPKRAKRIIDEESSDEEEESNDYDDYNESSSSSLEDMFVY